MRRFLWTGACAVVGFSIGTGLVTVAATVGGGLLGWLLADLVSAQRRRQARGPR